MGSAVPQVLTNEVHWRLWTNGRRVQETIENAEQQPGFKMEAFLRHVLYRCHMVSNICCDDKAAFSVLGTQGQEMFVVDNIKPEMFCHLSADDRILFSDRYAHYA